MIAKQSHPCIYRRVALSPVLNITQGVFCEIRMCAVTREACGPHCRHYYSACTGRHIEERTEQVEAIPPSAQEIEWLEVLGIG